MKVSIKKIILIIIASVVGSFLLAVVGLVLYFKMQFSVYQDDQYKFSILYPNTWKVIVHPKKNVAVIFLRPKDTDLDVLQENFNVTVQPLPEGIVALDEFSDRIKAQMIGVFGARVRFVQYKQLLFGGKHRGYQMVIEAPEPDNLKMVNAWTVRDNQSYILTFLGNIDKYAQDSFVVGAMIRSFRLR